MSSLINRAALKRFLLDRAKIQRPHHNFTRVNEEALEHFENQLRIQADQLICHHPAKGITIKP